jgi:transposase
MEIITRGERRRSWTAEQKHEIVAESLGPDLTPTEVARKHAISSGQLYTWRQQLLGMQGTVVSRSPPRFAPVELNPPPTAPAPSPAEPHACPSALLPRHGEGLIEILLPGGVSVRVDAHVDGRALRRVLAALESR